MKYSSRAGRSFEIPDSMHLLNKVMQIEANLIEWVKQNKYHCADDYSCGIDKYGRWYVSYTNDYPMQHGNGGVHIFDHSEYFDAQKLEAKID